MALVPTTIGLYESKGAIGKAAYTTPSFTPPANSLLVVAVNFIGEGLTGDLGTPTISGGGLTYTSRTSAVGSPAWCTKLVIFTAPVGGSPASMTLTVDDDNDQVIAGYTVEVVALTGYDTTTPVTGAVSSGSTDIKDGAETQTLAATPTAEDLTLSWVLIDGEPGPPKPSLAAGWTLIHEGRFYGSEGGVFSMRRAESTSTSVTITDVWTSATFYKGSMVSLIVKAAKKEEGKALKLELADGAIGGDSVSKGIGLAIADGAVGGDVIAKSPQKVNADGAVVGDSVAKASQKGIADGGVGGDQLAKTVGKAGLEDGAVGGDSLARKAGKVLADVGVLADALVKAFIRRLSDGAIGSDELEVELQEVAGPSVKLPASATVDPYEARASVDATALAQATVDPVDAIATIGVRELVAELEPSDAIATVEACGAIATFEPQVLAVAEVI